MPELRGEELARATLEYIREHPGEWDQGTYCCGTTACFAGRALLLSEGRLNNDRARTELRAGNWHRSKAYHAASKKLGWNEDEASRVFYNVTDNFEELKASVEAVLRGELSEVPED